MNKLQQVLVDQLLREGTILVEDMNSELCMAVCGLHNLGLATYSGTDGSLSINEGALQQYLRLDSPIACRS